MAKKKNTTSGKTNNQIIATILVVAVASVLGFLLGTRVMESGNSSKVELTQSQAAPSTTTTKTTTTGNGGPAGSHFNLNLIGVPKEKTADMTGGDGRRIFVPLEGSCQVKLAMGDFQVLDGNCTDGSAQFQLPNPDPTNTGITTYSVWARALGKPGGSSETTTCAVDPLDGQTYCSLYSMVQTRGTGKSSFTNVSKQLLYVYADINADGTIERMPLFDDRLQDYYWQYDNSGLKNMQLRFYPIATNVN